MEIEEAITYHLENAAAVAAIAGDRIYPNIIPQDVSKPAIAYQIITRQSLMAHDGPVGYAWPRVQITAHGPGYEEVVDLIREVKIAFDGFAGLMGGVGGVTVEGCFVKDIRDDFEFATDRTTRRLDVVIHHID